MQVGDKANVTLHGEITWVGEEGFDLYIEETDSELEYIPFSADVEILVPPVVYEPGDIYVVPSTGCIFAYDPTDKDPEQPWRTVYIPKGWGGVGHIGERFGDTLSSPVKLTSTDGW